ncbi:MAG: ankyrin repeat domain-containing protein [Rickettsiaceae bacterium H1]|nr:ankyrin repeat domain-containing protein [Rickettsiaceae bacterium H1]
MYIICVIFFLLPIYGFSDPLQISDKESKSLAPVNLQQNFNNKIEEKINLPNSANDEEQDDEELYPNLPLTLDDNILNQRNKSLITNKEKKANVGKGKVIKNTSQKQSENNHEDTTKIDDKFPGKKNTTNISPWLVPEQKPLIEKKFIILPESISRKKYNEINQYLPKATYMSDYKKLLFQEVKNNNVNAIRALIELIEDVDFRDENGNTPLLYAVNQGKIDMVRLLIMKDSDLMAKNLNYQSAYDLAIKNGRLDILNILNDAKS